MASEECGLHGPLNNGTCLHCDEEEGGIDDAEEVGFDDLPDPQRYTPQTGSQSTSTGVYDTSHSDVCPSNYPWHTVIQSVRQCIGESFRLPR